MKRPPRIRNARPLGVSDIRIHDLVRRAQAGDRDSFARLMHAMRDQLARLIQKTFAIQSADVEDALQDSLLKISTALHRFDLNRGVRFTTWASTIALNHCRDLLRRRRFLAASFTDDDGIQIEDDDPPPLEHASHQELLQSYSAALRKLPAHHREILELRTEQDLSYDEIGKRLGTTVGTVKSRLYRARRSLWNGIPQLEDLRNAMADVTCRRAS